MTDFADRIRELALQIPKHMQIVKTEEGTKNAMIMPFIMALGYNVNDPTEVNPEFTADFGTRQHEKIDYAIMKDGKVIILIECKCCTDDLSVNHASQLYRYYSVANTRFGILTNGVVYRFYTDLEAANKMDTHPFFEFNMLDFSDYQIEELKKFTNSAFNLDSLLTAASELKFTREIKRILAEEMKKPSKEFVSFFVRQIYTGKMTEAVKNRFTEFTKNALAQFVNDRVNQRLKAALSGEQEPEVVPIEPGRQIENTADELEGYYIVKTILREVIPAKRVVAKDTLSYFGILLDNNVRKPLCRLHLNRGTKYISLFDKNRVEERVKIDNVDQIYTFADRLKSTIKIYDKQGERETEQ